MVKVDDVINWAAKCSGIARLKPDLIYTLGHIASLSITNKRGDDLFANCSGERKII